MRANKKSQTGSAQLVTLIVLVVAIIGVLGFVFWNSFLKKEPVATQTNTTPKVEQPCTTGENTAAEKGTFCSKELGAKLTVPSIFKNKLAKTANYEVFKDASLDPNNKMSAGSSEAVYRATMTGNDNFDFTIAQEPLRTGYVDVSHQLQSSYYDQATGNLTLVKTPSRYYDSTTGTYTVTGSYSKGEAVPSFTADGTTFFKAVSGDAGQTIATYFAVINNKIVKISLKHAGYMGDPANDPSTIDAATVFSELETAVKAIKIIKS